MTEAGGAGAAAGDPASARAARPKRPHYEGDPTLARVMRRPKWIAALALALAVAAGFAWLGQWQLGHAIATDSQQPNDSEAARPIGEVTAPGTSVRDAAAGMVVALSGRFVEGDFAVVEQRMHDGDQGAWVVGHLAETGGSGGSDGSAGHLAVAIGWAPSAEQAERAAVAVDSRLAGEALSVEGRYMPSEAAKAPAAGDDPLRLLTMVPGQLVNLWQPFSGPAYAGFLVLHPGAAGDPLGSAALEGFGLEVIDSVPPLPAQTVNWLNLFYAVEWVVFAGFAVYFWYRLTRDEWEREHELQQLAAAEQLDEQ